MARHRATALIITLLALLLAACQAAPEPTPTSPPPTMTPSVTPTPTATPTPQPTATETPTPTATEYLLATGECLELIQNGGFEAEGPEPWVTETNLNKPPLIGNLRTNSGSMSAGLGDGMERNADERLYQDVTLPSGLVSASFSYWWDKNTREAGNQSLDLLVVTIQDLDGNVLATLAEYNSLAGPSFVFVTETFDVLAYAGQTIRVHFHVTTDAENESDFSIDDVSLFVCGE